MDLKSEVERINEIADGVIDISKAMKKLREGKLSENALIVLLHHSSGVPMKVIKKVLGSLDTLAEVYVKQPQKGEKQ